MKNKFFITSIFCLLFSQFLLSQENKVAKSIRDLNNDTTEYIEQRIMNNKNLYIGKPLDSLLKDLPKVVNYANGDMPRNRLIYPTTVLFFTSYGNTMNKLDQKKFPMVLTITWAMPLNNSDLPAGLKIGGGEWTENAYNYYKNKIIGKIETVEYNFQ